MLTFVIDQCVPSQLASAVHYWNAANPTLVVDVVSVGEPPDLPFGSLDPVILDWAERNERIVVTTDYSTMPGHLEDHLAAGKHLPGILFLRPESRYDELVESLVIIATAGVPEDFRDIYLYIPL